MIRLKSQSMPSPTCPQLLQKIITAQFSQQQEFNYPTIQCQLEEILSVMMDELREACDRVEYLKAPGLDEIPNIALKTAIKTVPALFLEVYDTCLREGTFPR
ncbi:hypothetical protein EVAR_35396_1 [Eumeta japonica]|uniref:Uncharacterized protein n=1 Tax=Eumeta variegata TaxID=151549 RepID=A0A4C1XBR2_EUMVA|nr:hypothetical protein EVAR_35396_1 [Eumeta japonica]